MDYDQELEKHYHPENFELSDDEEDDPEDLEEIEE